MSFGVRAIEHKFTANVKFLSVSGEGALQVPKGQSSLCVLGFVQEPEVGGLSLCFCAVFFGRVIFEKKGEA